MPYVSTGFGAPFKGGQVPFYGQDAFGASRTGEALRNGLFSPMEMQNAGVNPLLTGSVAGKTERFPSVPSVPEGFNPEQTALNVGMNGLSSAANLARQEAMSATKQVKGGWLGEGFKNGLLSPLDGQSGTLEETGTAGNINEEGGNYTPEQIALWSAKVKELPLPKKEQTPEQAALQSALSSPVVQTGTEKKAVAGEAGETDDGFSWGGLWDGVKDFAASPVGSATLLGLLGAGLPLALGGGAKEAVFGALGSLGTAAKNQREYELKKQKADNDTALLKARLDAMGFDQKLAQDEINLRKEQLDRDYQEKIMSFLNPTQEEKALAQLDIQLRNFEDMFSKMPGKWESYTTGALRDLSGLDNETEAEFEAQRTLLFNAIARTLGGEKGVLSDGDIKRIEKSLPSRYDSLEQKQAKMGAIRQLLNIRAGNLLNRAQEMPEWIENQRQINSGRQIPKAYEDAISGYTETQTVTDPLGLKMEGETWK